MPVWAPKVTDQLPSRLLASATSSEVVLSSPRPRFSGTSTISRPQPPARRSSSGISPAFFDSISRSLGRISFVANRVRLREGALLLVEVLWGHDRAAASGLPHRKLLPTGSSLAI